MNKLKQIQKIQEIYQQGGNLMEYFRNTSGASSNDIESILISYDLQAGSYIKNAETNADYIDKYTASIANVIRGLGPNQSIMEVGVGEATVMANVLNKLPDFSAALGFDISWSRIKYAQKYAASKGRGDIRFFTANLFNIPLADKSIDVIYTSHSLEPNGGHEKPALQELSRVARNYIVLLEPGYEFASKEGKERMEKHGYVKNLQTHAVELGLQVTEHRLFDHYINALNPTALTIIKIAPSQANSLPEPALCCPATHRPLDVFEDACYCRESGLAYPVIGGIPCLLMDNAVLATRYLD